MPVYTHTHTAEDKHTDRQTSADNTESFLLCQTLSCFTAGPRIYTGLPVPDTVLLHSRARIYTGLPAPDTVLLHSRAPDFHWTSCTRHLPASQQDLGFTLDFLHQTPSCFTAGPRIYTGLPAPDTSCFTAGSRIYTGLPVPDTFLLHSRARIYTGLFLSCLRQCWHTHKNGKPKTNTRTAENTELVFQAPWVFLSTGAIIYPSLLSWKCSPPPVKGCWTSPQMLCPMSESPSGKREGLQDNATGKKGTFITDSSQGPLLHPTQWCRSESPEPQLLHKFIGWAHAIGLSRLVTSLQSNFIGQNFHAGGTSLGVSTLFLIS